MRSRASLSIFRKVSPFVPCCTIEASLCSSFGFSSSCGCCFLSYVHTATPPTSSPIINPARLCFMVCLCRHGPYCKGHATRRKVASTLRRQQDGKGCPFSRQRAYGNRSVVGLH